MNRRIATVLGTAILGLGLGAFAGNEPYGKDKPTTPEAGRETTTRMVTMDARMGKHLALVNVYIGQAILNTKALNSLIDMNVPAREQHVKELTKNLDLAVKGAIVHAGHIRKMNDPALNRITELESSLKQAKSALAKLKKAKDADIGTQIDLIGSNLSSCDRIFRDMAKTANFTRLEDQGLETVPVRGTEGVDQEPLRRPSGTVPPKHDTDLLPEPAQPTSPPSSTEPKY